MWPFDGLFGSPKPLLPKTVANVNSTVVPTGVPATQQTVPPSQAANVAGAAARAPPSEILVQPRRGEYVALGGSRKGGKGRKGSKGGKGGKGGKGKSKKSKASKSRK
jgi:hypothetical protein